jgi:hypothetical protein
MTNEQQFNDFEEWYDFEHQRIEQERLLQREQKEQELLNKSRIKKIEDENVSYTDDLHDVFPKYYDKSFKPVKKDNSKDFVFFKYSTNNGNIDNDNEKEDLESEEQSSSSSSEEPESENLLLKEIELLFENGYFHTDIEEMFPKFYKINKSKINFLYKQVIAERYRRDPTLELQKNIDVYKCRQEQIDIIEKRRQFQKTVRKNRKHERSHHDTEIQSYKRFKAKKDFKSFLNDEIKKVEEQSEGQKRFKRDDGDDTEDEEEIIIIEHRPDPLTVINTPIQHNVAPAATQPIAKHHRILRDDN